MGSVKNNENYPRNISTIKQYAVMNGENSLFDHTHKYNIYDTNYFSFIHISCHGRSIAIIAILA